MYLSDQAVRYYLPIAIEYAASDDSVTDCIFVGGLASSLAFRLEHNEFCDETKLLSETFAKLVLSDLAKYDLDRDRKDDRFWIRSLEDICSQTQDLRW